MLFDYSDYTVPSKATYVEHVRVEHNPLEGPFMAMSNYIDTFGWFRRMLFRLLGLEKYISDMKIAIINNKTPQ